MLGATKKVAPSVRAQAVATPMVLATPKAMAASARRAEPAAGEIFVLGWGRENWGRLCPDKHHADSPARV